VVLWGDAWASVYDAMTEGDTDTEAAVAQLSTLIPAGSRVLEVGVGTGRILGPLARTGYSLVGIDESSEMIRLAQAKVDLGTGPELVHLSCDEMTYDEEFDAVLCLYNTLFYVDDVGRQRESLARMVSALRPGGLLVMESFSPGGPVARGERAFVSVGSFDRHRTGLQLALHDPETQRLTLRHLDMMDDAWQPALESSMRYCWPAELDAILWGLGMTMEDSWSDWDATPWRAAAGWRICSYRRPG
jgi:SAM-dependent methyltransferase